MWVLFGLVTLIAACVYDGVRRFRGRWSGLALSWQRMRTPRGESPLGRMPYRFNQFGRKQGQKTVQLAVDTATVLDFECKPENRMDRFFKWSGLALEQQLGQDDFDQAIYLISDDRRMLEALNHDPRVVAILKSFFCKPPQPDYRAVRLVCRGGTLRLDLRETSLLPARSVDMMDVVIPALHELGERLPARILQSDKVRDPLTLRTILVLALSTGLAIHGGTHLLRLAMFGGSITLEPMRLFLTSLPVAAVLLGLLVMATLVLLARSSRVHLVMAEVLLVGLLGAFSTAFVEVRDLNMALDRSPTATLQATVLEKYSRRSRRSGTRYYLVLSDWPTAGERKARVDGGTYDAVAVGDPVVLFLRQGWLQIPWLERIEKDPNPAERR